MLKTRYLAAFFALLTAFLVSQTHAVDISSWSTTAANNATADSDINWAEGQNPSTVNNSARMMMAKLAQFAKAMGVNPLVTGGTTTAYTVSPTHEPATLAGGWSGLVQFNAANTGASQTFKVGALAAAALKDNTGANIDAGRIAANSVHVVAYDVTNSYYRVLTLAGASDVTGPASATDNAIARFDGTGGKTIQNTSGATIDDSTNVTFRSTAALELSLERFSADAGDQDIAFRKSRNGTLGQHTVVNADDAVASIYGEASDGTNYEDVAKILFQVGSFSGAASPGNDDMPGMISFSTTSDGGTSLVERMRIDSEANTSVIIQSLVDDANSGPVLQLYRNSATAAASDNLGQVRFTGEDGGGSFQEYGRFTARILDETAASEDGSMLFELTQGGTGGVDQMLLESDHDAFLYKDDGANAGQIVAEHWIMQGADRTLASNTNPQALFDETTNGTLTVDTGKYFFQCMIHMSAMSATSGNAQFLLGGTATYSQVLFQVTGVDSSTPLAAAASSSSGAVTATGGAASMVTAGTGTGLLAWVNGSFDVTAAGTVIPQVDQVTAAAAVVEQETYCRFHRGGSNAAGSIGAWN